MAIIVTPSRRRLAMTVLLALALAGAVIRAVAPNPSTQRDVGTLLLVLWLPAVGNLVAYLLRKIPRRAPPATDFPAGTTFTPQLQVRMERAGLSAQQQAALDPAERRCTLLVGPRGFTARLAEPVAQALDAPGPRSIALELLHPAVALPQLAPGTDFHVLVATTAVAVGRVQQVVGRPLQA
jgi:hypothetical protein